MTHMIRKRFNTLRARMVPALMSMGLLSSMLVGFSSCSEDEVTANPEQFFYDIPSTPLTEPLALGCFYQVPADPQNAQKPYTPIDVAYLMPDETTMYDITDPEITKQHVDSALAYGIDYFVIRWDSKLTTTTETTYRKVLNNLVAMDTPMKFVPEIDFGHFGVNASNQLSPDVDLSSMVGMEILQKDLEFFATQYLENGDFKSHWQMIDNRPAFTLTTNMGNKNIDFGFVADTLRHYFQEYCHVDPYLVAEYATPFTPPERYESIFKHFDSVTCTSMKPNTYDRRYGYFSFVDLNWTLWKETLDSWGMSFTPTIWTAYDRSNEKNPSGTYDVERTPENFRSMCNVAKRTVGEDRMVLLYSWNDFKFGASLEPAVSYGSSYLQIMREELVDGE